MIFFSFTFIINFIYCMVCYSWNHNNSWIWKCFTHNFLIIVAEILTLYCHISNNINRGCCEGKYALCKKHCLNNSCPIGLCVVNITATNMR